MEKKSIISEIFYGNRGNGETIKASEKYCEFMNEASKLAKELNLTFDDKQKELFDKFDLTSNQLEAEAVLTYFIEGFKIGLLIGKEVFEGY